MDADVIVVGSGPSAVNASFPLVEAGYRVLMLDIGHREGSYAGLVPAKPFGETRRTDGEQWRYFLGEDFEGVCLGEVRVGSQLTPPRRYVTTPVERLAPIVSNSFSTLEGFAIGGLGAAWGAGAFPFSAAEMEGWPISRADLQPHYERVAERIGVSGATDDIAECFGPPIPMQPPLRMDSNSERIYEAYRARRAALIGAGFRLGITWLAVCSTTHRGRLPNAYHDTEFWGDGNGSVYRAYQTVAELLKRPNFGYRASRLVSSFEESLDGGVRVHSTDLDSGHGETTDARRLVIAAGTLGTARIVLRSLDLYDTRLPIVCNPYTYVPCLNTLTFGKQARDRRHSLSQLTAVYDGDGSGRHNVQVQVYSYRSLMCHRLLGTVPLALPDAIHLLAAAQPHFSILGINHEDRPTPLAGLALRRGDRGTAERLEISYEVAPQRARRQRLDERRVVGHFRSLGLLPLKRIHPGHGASIHYGGTLPMCSDERPLSTDACGRLRGTANVYVVDGSVLPYLPAKGLTMTLMANADRVGCYLAKDIGR